jgi:type I restriction enzyme M protein
MTNFRDRANFLWSLAEILRGEYKPHEWGGVILPLVVLRRLDCVLEPTKAAVLKKHSELEGKIENVEPILRRVSGEQFYNISKLDMPRLLDDPPRVRKNLRAYVAGFDSAARDILDKFKFDDQINRLDDHDLLFLMVKRFCGVDLHPNVVDNVEMGYMFEELIRLSSEQSNETAGEHFTPREVVRLMVNLLFVEDDDLLRKRGIVRTLYDPACGTGGMLSVAEDYLRELNVHARLELFGQELNEESYAICRADMMLKGHDASHIHVGNSFTRDGESGSTFDYMLSNPPFGVDWKKVAKEIREEHDRLGDGGRFGAGLPRVSDGSLLFLQHMISKMKAGHGGGSRIAIVFNGSPLFSGGAGSGESDIRRWIIENDWLEAVVALPDQLFYNTWIFTYIWIVTNRKPEHRRKKVQLIDARKLSLRMRKSLGEKRNELSEEHIEQITQLFAEFQDGPLSLVLDNDDLGYRRVPIDRPLRVRYELSQDVVERLAGSAKFALLPDEVRALLERKLADDVKEGARRIDRRAELDAYVLGALEGLDLQRKDVTAAKKVIAQHAVIRDEVLEPETDSRGRILADTALRDFEPVPLSDNVEDYFEREVKPYWPDAWVGDAEGKIGYEIPFTRVFYEFPAQRSSIDLREELARSQPRIAELLEGVVG